MNKKNTRSRAQLIISMKKRRLFGENGSDIVDVHAGIEINQKIFERRQKAADIPESHKGILRVIREVENEESKIREDFRKAGIAEEYIPSPSRALKRLNIEERLRGNKTHWRETNAAIELHNLLEKGPSKQ
jgi:hypothetical protein